VIPAIGHDANLAFRALPGIGRTGIKSGTELQEIIAVSSHQAELGASERELLVAGHAYLVDREAARYRTWHLDRADLRQAGIPDLIGRTVALRRALAENADSLNLAAAALGISPATVAALHRQLRTTATEDDEELPAPGYTLTSPEHAIVAHDFTAAARAALARMDPRQADALILRYGLDNQPERSFRQIGRHLGVSDHTARNLVERAQTELRRLVT
jgi:RNA polymerase sigma factor (sigma-70 family)